MMKEETNNDVEFTKKERMVRAFVYASLLTGLMLLLTVGMVIIEWVIARYWEGCESMYMINTNVLIFVAVTIMMYALV